MDASTAGRACGDAPSNASLAARKGVKSDLDGLSGAFWKKSTHSYGNGDCVEAAPLAGGHVAVRDSKDKTGPVLMFSPSEWRAFLGGVKGGEFDFIG
jgi:hypothetical protein